MEGRRGGGFSGPGKTLLLSSPPCESLLSATLLRESYCGMLILQFAPHVAVLSHCSPNWDSTFPSPQYGANLQAVVQMPGPYAVDDEVFDEPSSQASGPFLMPSPQYPARVQLALHVP